MQVSEVQCCLDPAEKIIPLKEIVNPKITLRPPVDVDEFVCSVVRFSITSPDHFTPVDPLQWMGAVRMTVQTADKNIT